MRVNDVYNDLSEGEKTGPQLNGKSHNFSFMDYTVKAG